MPNAPQNMEVIAPTKNANVVNTPAPSSTQKNTIPDINSTNTKQILYSLTMN